jgi:hypothetical protein
METSLGFRQNLMAIKRSSVILNESSRLHSVVFLIILIAAIQLRLVFFQGYNNSDPSAYSILANDLAQGIVHIHNYDDAPGFRNRFGVHGPAAVFIKLFGLSEITLSIYPFLASLVSLLLVYVLSRCLFNPFAGLVSMAIITILPFDIAMSTTFYADPIEAAWANAGIALLIVGSNGDQRLPAWRAILAGLCFGISWLCKESIAYLAPFVVAYLIFLERRESVWRNIIYVGLGSISVLVAESVFYQITAGDYLFHFHELARNDEESYMFRFDQRSPIFGWAEGGYAKALAKRLFLSGPWQLLNAFAGLPAFAIVALGWGTIMRDRRFLIPGMWFLTLIIMFNFCSMSLVAYEPMLLDSPNYLYPLIAPAAVLVGGLVAILLKSEVDWNLRRERMFWAGTVVLVFLLICVHGVKGLKVRPEQLARDAVGRINPSDLVYTDYRTAATLVFLRTGLLLQSNNNTVPYENIDINSMQSGAYVLINKAKSEFFADAYSYKIPTFVYNPPNAWKEVVREGDGALFRIN